MNDVISQTFWLSSQIMYVIYCLIVRLLGLDLLGDPYAVARDEALPPQDKETKL